jgi:hypothetical protein
LGLYRSKSIVRNADPHLNSGITAYAVIPDQTKDTIQERSALLSLYQRADALRA